MKAKTTNQILRSALRLIQKGWTKGAYARNKNNRAVKPHGKAACKFCVYGALLRACDSTEYETSEGFHNADVALCDALGDGPINLADWNDSPNTDKKWVVDIFKSAIRATA